MKVKIVKKNWTFYKKTFFRRFGNRGSSCRRLTRLQVLRLSKPSLTVELHSPSTIQLFLLYNEDNGGFFRCQRLYFHKTSEQKFYSKLHREHSPTTVFKVRKVIIQINESIKTLFYEHLQELFWWSDRMCRICFGRTVKLPPSYWSTSGQPRSASSCWLVST